MREITLVYGVEGIAATGRVVAAVVKAAEVVQQFSGGG
jgi:hypothetical protein